MTDRYEEQLRARFGASYRSNERYSNEPVLYDVTLKPSIDGHKVKSELEALADDLQVNILDLKNIKRQYVNGKTSQATYESVFGAELRYVTRVIPNLNRGPREVGEWVEVKPAAVPPSLKDQIKSIGLAEMMYLTD